MHATLSLPTQANESEEILPSSIGSVAQSALRALRDNLEQHLGVTVAESESVLTAWNKFLKENKSKLLASQDQINRIGEQFSEIEEFSGLVIQTEQESDEPQTVDQYSQSIVFLTKSIQKLSCDLAQELRSLEFQEPILKVDRNTNAKPVSSESTRQMSPKPAPLDDLQMIDKLLDEKGEGTEEKNEEGSEEATAKRKQDPYTAKIIAELERLRNWFKKFGQDSDTKIADYGKAATKDIEVVSEVGFYQSKDPTFETSLATMYPNILKANGNLIPMQLWLREDDKKFDALVRTFYQIKNFSEFSSDIGENETVVTLPLDVSFSCICHLSFSHRHELIAAQIECADGTLRHDVEALECKLGGAFVELPEGAKSIRYKIKYKEPDEYNCYANTLQPFLPKPPALFPPDSGIEELRSMVDAKYLPALVLDYLVEEGVTYAQGPEIHAILSGLGENWMAFGLGLKAPGKCAQLSTMAAAGCLQLGTPAVVCSGVIPEKGLFLVSRMHAQALALGMSRVPQVLEAVGKVKTSVINIDQVPAKELSEKLVEAAAGSRAIAQAIGAELNPRLVEVEPEPDFPAGSEGHDGEEQQLLQRVREMQQGQGSEKLERIPIRVLMQTAKGLKNLRDALNSAAITGDFQAVTEARQYLDDIKISNESDEIKIARKLHRLMTLKLGSDLFFTNKLCPQARTTLLEMFVAIEQGERVKCGTYETHCDLQHQPYTYLDRKDFLHCLSNDELKILAKSVEAVERKVERDGVTTNELAYDLRKASGFEGLTRSLTEEFVYRKIQPSKCFVRSAIAVCAPYDKRLNQDIALHTSFLEPLGSIFPECLVEVAVRSYYADTFLELLAKHGSGLWTPNSSMAQTINTTFVSNVGQVVDDFLEGVPQTFSIDELGREFWAQRFQHLELVANAFSKFSPGDSVRIYKPSSQLSSACRAFLDEQTKYFQFEFLNPPLPAYPMSTYIRKASRGASDMLDAFEILGKCGLADPAILYGDQDPAREAGIVGETANILRGEKSPLRWRFCSTSGFSSDENRVIQGIECSLPLIRRQFPSLGKFISFCKPKGRNSDLLSAVQKLSPLGYEKICDAVSDARTKDSQDVVADSMIAITRQEGLAREKMLPAIVWAERMRLKNPEIFRRSIEGLLTLQAGVDSPVADISARVFQEPSVQSDYLRSVLGDPGITAKAAALLLVDALVNDGSIEVKHSYKSYTPNVRTLATSVFRFPYGSGENIEQFVGQNLNGSSDPLREVIIGLSGAKSKESSYRSKDEDQFDANGFENRLVSSLESATRYGNRMLMTAAGETLLDYEHSLKKIGGKRLTLAGERDFDHFRPYAPGDDIRRLNKAALAKDKLFVRVDKQHTQERDLEIVVDAGQFRTFPRQICDELMSQIVLGAVSGFRKVNLVISLGVEMARFDDLTRPSGDGGMKFRSHKFLTELSEALAETYKVQRHRLKDFSLSPLAYTQRPQKHQQKTYLLLPGGTDELCLKRDLHKLNRRGDSVYKIDISQLRRRDRKVRPEEVRKEMRRYDDEFGFKHELLSSRMFLSDLD